MIHLKPGIGAGVTAMLAAWGNDAFSNCVLFTDFNQPLHPHRLNLQRDAGGPAGHEDGRAPFVRVTVRVRTVCNVMSAYSSFYKRCNVSFNLIAFNVLFRSIPRAPRLLHPKPVSGDAVGAKSAVISNDVNPSRLLSFCSRTPTKRTSERRNMFDDSTRLSLPTFEDGADHRRGEKDGAFFHLVPFSSSAMSLSANNTDVAAIISAKTSESPWPWLSSLD